MNEKFPKQETVRRTWDQRLSEGEWVVVAKTSEEHTCDSCDKIIPEGSKARLRQYTDPTGGLFGGPKIVQLYKHYPPCAKLTIEELKESLKNRSFEP